MEETNPKQIKGQTALEQALKSHFEQNQLPDFGNYLLNKILSRVNYQRQLKILKPKLWTAIGVFLTGLGLLVLAADVSFRAFAQTPTSHYFALIFTDFSLIMANWQDYSLGILENLPLGAMALLLSCLLGSILLVDFSTHRFLNFRKTLNSLHYEPRHKLV
jgi:hypothetical protein